MARGEAGGAEARGVALGRTVAEAPGATTGRTIARGAAPGRVLAGTGRPAASTSE